MEHVLGLKDLWNMYSMTAHNRSRELQYCTAQIKVPLSDYSLLSHISVLASQISTRSTDSKSCSGYQQMKHHKSILLVLCEWNPPVDTHSSQRVSNVGNVSMSWCQCYLTHGCTKEFNSVHISIIRENVHDPIMSLWNGLYIITWDRRNICIFTWTFHS